MMLFYSFGETIVVDFVMTEFFSLLVLDWLTEFIIRLMIRDGSLADFLDREQEENEKK